GRHLPRLHHRLRNPPGSRARNFSLQFSVESFPRRKNRRTQSLARDHARMERLLSAARRGFWRHRPGGVSWSLRIQRARRRRRFRSPEPVARTSIQGALIAARNFIILSTTTTHATRHTIGHIRW